MSNYIYENHFHRDPNFPVIFHCDILNKNRPSFLMHYHENIELLYFLDGHAKVVCDNKILQAKADDIIIINSKELHSIEKISDSCKYYCLIIDKDLLNDNLNDFDNFRFKNLVKDSFLKTKIEEINRELNNKNDYFKEFIKSDILQILIHIKRNHIEQNSSLIKIKDNNKILMVKEIINYLKENYKEQISIDHICNHVAFSKYYTCRTFKEVTGQTIQDYINHIRCINARNLILYNGYTISESAYKSGFNNLSYFSKTYKKYIGLLPSEEKIT